MGGTTGSKLSKLAALASRRAAWAGWCLVAISGAHAVPVRAEEIPDIERGRALYENHCQVCHTPNVHTRPNRIAITIEDLRQLVSAWAQQEKLRWSGEDVEDVVAFLNATRYRY